jgi:peptidoglycan/xylan/chitin deacetylase (PgdA/CDA1 family)
MGKAVLFKLLRCSGLPLLFREVVQRRRITILLFHDLSKETAAQAFDFLAAKYHLLDLQTFLQMGRAGARLPPKSLILTFDDGYLGNYELLPLIQERRIPVTIFLCAGIIDTKRHFWFKDRSARHRCFRLRRMSEAERVRLLQEAGFTRQMEHAQPQALSRRQIEEMKPWVDFQSHTLFHPCLPRCSGAEAQAEIACSRDLLCRQYGLTINAISYPHGDYSDRDIELCRQAGYDCGITVDFGFNTVHTDRFRLKRLSINDTNDLNELIVKASGLWDCFRTILGKNREFGWTDDVEP